MKKIFALTIALCAMTAVFAQGHRNGSRDVVLGQRGSSVYDRDHRDGDRRDNDRYFTARERDEMIQRIHREYNWKVESVRRDRYMRNGEKKRRIRQLENERDYKVREVRERFERAYRYNGRRY